MLLHLARNRFVCTKIRRMSSYPIMSKNIENTKNNVAILRTLEDGEKFTFSFHLETTKFGGFKKQFNMCRNVDETLSDFVTRLSCNVEKVINKKAKNKKSKIDTPVPDKLEISFIQNGKILTDDSLKIQDILLKSETEFGIGDEIFKIDINPPLVESAALPNKIMYGFMVYPYKLKLESAVKSDSKYEWFVSDEVYVDNQIMDQMDDTKDDRKIKRANNKMLLNVEHVKWSKKADGYYFTPTHDDLNRYVKFVCYPKLKDRCGLIYQTVSKCTVSEGPNQFPFETRHKFTPDIVNEDEFRVVSYNLLADLYADSDFSRTVLFSQCPPDALAIEYRKQLILKELLGYNADIICLQEVDNKIFDYDLLPVLSEKGGLDGVFDRKGGKVSEGLACFWRTTKFRKLKALRYVLCDSLQSDNKLENMLKIVKSNQQLYDSMINRTTAIQIVVLESIQKPNHGLIIGTTHLYFKPDADHIRLMQTAICISHLERTLAHMKEEKPDMHFSIIFAGDFNSTPPYGVLKFIREGFVDHTHSDWSSCLAEQVLGMSIRHSFSMDSACGTPKFTNYTTGFKDCLDYIFYEKDKLQVENIVPFPPEEVLKKYDAIPNIVFPSDHLASICNLKWKL